MPDLLSEKTRTIQIGNKVNHLTVIGNPFLKKEGANNRSYVECKCDCGKIVIKPVRYITAGKARYCDLSCPSRKYLSPDMPDTPADNPLPIGFECNLLTTTEETLLSIRKNNARLIRVRIIKCKCKCGNEGYFLENRIKNKEYYGCQKKCKFVVERDSARVRKGTLAENGFKRCSKCLEMLPVDNFFYRRHTIDNLRNECIACERNNYLRKKYNLSLEEAQALLIKQEGRCKICLKEINFYVPGGTKESIIRVDHCHSTHKVRGLLCNTCNFLLGCAMDNISILHSAIGYLNEFNNNPTNMSTLHEKNKSNQD